MRAGVPTGQRGLACLMRDALPYAGLVAVVVFFSLTSDFFFNLRNFERLVTDSATLMLVAFGMTLVILLGDDPGGWSSQNEQDSRWLARTAEVPIVEPTSVEQAGRAAPSADPQLELADRVAPRVPERAYAPMRRALPRFLPR